jgi:hypothetical protein
MTLTKLEKELFKKLTEGADEANRRLEIVLHQTRILLANLRKFSPPETPNPAGHHPPGSLSSKGGSNEQKEE